MLSFGRGQSGSRYVKISTTTAISDMVSTEKEISLDNEGRLAGREGKAVLHSAFGKREIFEQRSE